VSIWLFTGVAVARRGAGQAAADNGAMNVVIDTNIALDLLLFDDAASRPLADVLAGGRLRWLATGAMREEFERVLGYPPMVARLARGERDAAALLAAFDARAVPAEAAARAPYCCADADDQIFIDLAVAHRALLLSKDRAILAMGKRLASLGVEVRAAFSSTVEVSAPAAPVHAGRW